MLDLYTLYFVIRGSYVHGLSVFRMMCCLCWWCMELMWAHVLLLWHWCVLCQGWMRGIWTLSGFMMHNRLDMIGLCSVMLGWMVFNWARPGIMCTTVWCIFGVAWLCEPYSDLVNGAWAYAMNRSCYVSQGMCYISKCACHASMVSGYIDGDQFYLELVSV